MSEETARQLHVTSGELRTAREALTGAKIARDPEAIKEATIEFDRAFGAHAAAVHAHVKDTTPQQGELL